jgi:hypothetical protein
MPLKLHNQIWLEQHKQLTKALGTQSTKIQLTSTTAAQQQQQHQQQKMLLETSSLHPG